MSEPKNKDEKLNDLSKAPIFDHLLELRSRLIRSFIIFIIGYLSNHKNNLLFLLGI